MTDKKDGGPAYPCAVLEQSLKDQGWHEICHPGMSLRDYFAAQALVGIIANSGWEPIEEDNELGYSTAAEIAYAVADSMLAAREDRSDE